MGSRIKYILSMRLILLWSMSVLLVCVTLSSCASLTSSDEAELSEERVKRGFKSTGLATFRGFGNRSDADAAIMNAESGVPANWLAMQIIQSPELAVSLLEKLLDVNRDGVLTAEELASIQQ